MVDRRETRAALFVMMLGVVTARPERVELDDPLENAALWDQFYTVRAGFGYTDNVLFSDLYQKPSAFLATGIDATLTRFPLDSSQVNFFVGIDDRRYFDGVVVTNLAPGTAATNLTDTIKGERTLLALAQWRRDFNSNWQGELNAQYFFQDQVIDLSVTEADLGALPVVGHQVRTGAEGRRSLGTNWWTGLELTGQRQWFEQSFVDSYWQYGPQLSMGTALSARSTLDASYRLERRDYDHREQYSTVGEPLAGTHLSYLAQTAEIDWRYHLDAARRWRWQARGGFGRNQDNGTGYFDFERWFGSLQLRYRDPEWEVRAQGRVTSYRYDVQVSDDPPGDLRQRLTMQVGVRVERTLRRALRVFAEYEFEQATSNLSYDSYTVNVVNGGVLWEF